MKTTIVATLALGAALAPALAEQRYDRRLEAAAIRIVAAKMGSLRGGFSADEEPQFTEAIDPNRPTYLSADHNRPDVLQSMVHPARASFNSF